LGWLKRIGPSLIHFYQLSGLTEMIPWTRVILEKLSHSASQDILRIETEGSLPCSKQPTTGSYSEPDESSLHTFLRYFLNVHSNIILPSTPMSSD
jgi:hypothetical protein